MNEGDSNAVAHSMQGLHLTGDLHGCAGPAELLTRPQRLAAACRAATQAQGLSIVGERWHAFPPARDGLPGGVTGMLLLAESHLAVHTWPESAQVTLDVFVCNHDSDNSQRAEALMAALVALFAPQRQALRRLQRGL